MLSFNYNKDCYGTRTEYQSTNTVAQEGRDGKCPSFLTLSPPLPPPSPQFISFDSKHPAKLIFPSSKTVVGATSCWWQVYNYVYITVWQATVDFWLATPLDGTVWLARLPQTRSMTNKMLLFNYIKYCYGTRTEYQSTKTVAQEGRDGKCPSFLTLIPPLPPPPPPPPIYLL